MPEGGPGDHQGAGWPAYPFFVFFEKRCASRCAEHAQACGLTNWAGGVNEKLNCKPLRWWNSVWGPVWPKAAAREGFDEKQVSSC